MRVVNLYMVKDKDVVNAVLHVPGTTTFHYVPISEVDNLIRNYQSRGIIVNIQELQMGEGNKVTLNFNRKQQSDPEKAFVPKKVTVDFSVIPVRQSTVEQIEKITKTQMSSENKKELVVEVMDQKATKGTASPSALSPEDSNKLVRELEDLPDFDTM